MTTKQEAASFNGLGIAPKLLEILNELGFETPTPIQSQSIPVSLERKDIVGIAQTGTGKTLAFGVPMIQLLAVHKGMGLVVLPTRELALQVDQNLKTIGEKIGLRTAVLIGGEPIERQLKALKRKPHIIIATPGRLIDHTERRSVDLSNVRILVLDEADMMLDMGFLPQIRSVLKLVPKERQTMLFSATMPSQIIKIASEYMALPTRIEVAPAGTSAENVEQEIIMIEKEDKLDYLKGILGRTKGSVLIFARTKHGVKNLTKKMKLNGFSAAEIHSDRSLGQRQMALNGFKLGQYRILIATDIAARGIDVKEIELVINYDLPEKSGDYVHRIGRTARAGKSGKAISFVLPAQLKNLREIEKLINKTLKINRVASDRPTAIAAPNIRQADKSAIRKPFRAKASSDNSGAQDKRGHFVKAYTSKNIKYSEKYKSSDNSKRASSDNASGRFNKTNNQDRYDRPAERVLTDKERFNRLMARGRR